MFFGGFVGGWVVGWLVCWWFVGGFGILVGLIWGLGFWGLCEVTLGFCSLDGVGII